MGTIAEKLEYIASNEERIFENGYNKGYGVGYAEAEGGSDGFWDAFWDNFQDYGKRVNYSDAFRRVNWTPEAFKPKYDIKPTNAYYMLSTNGDYVGTFDLAEHLKELGVVFDFSNCAQMQGVFADSRFTGVPIVDTRSASNITYLFSYAFYIKKIEKLILKEDGSQSIDNIFQSVKYLEDIEIEGYFGKTFSLQWAENLTTESAINIIMHLKDYGTDEANFNKYTISFHPNVWSKLEALGNDVSPFEDSWRDYCTDLGWLTA